MTQIDFSNLRQYDLETLMKAEAETHEAILQFEISTRYLYFCQGNSAETEQKVRECFFKSARWLKKSEAQGYPVAGVLLGVFYAKGIGVKQNGEKAFRLFMKYADKNSYAILMVAECYEHGEGVKQNIVKALEWYTKAVNSNIEEVEHEARKKIFFFQKTWNEKNMDMVIVDKKKNYAVGLRYYRGEYPAPIITKRETGERAKKLCDSANDSGITVIKNESLARGIYNDSFIGFVLPEKYIGKNILKDVVVAYAKMIAQGLAEKCKNIS